MRIILIFILLTLCNSVSADGLYLGGWSKHFFYSEHPVHHRGFNNSHKVVALEKNNWVLGYFENSYWDDTALLTRKYNMYSGKNWDLDIGVGLTYGYKTCNNIGEVAYPYKEESKVCPAIAPELTYTKYKVQPSFMILNGALAMVVRVNF